MHIRGSWNTSNGRLGSCCIVWGRDARYESGRQAIEGAQSSPAKNFPASFLCYCWGQLIQPQSQALVRRIKVEQPDLSTSGVLYPQSNRSLWLRLLFRISISKNNLPVILFIKCISANLGPEVSQKVQWSKNKNLCH